MAPVASNYHNNNSIPTESDNNIIYILARITWQMDFLGLSLKHTHLHCITMSSRCPSLRMHAAHTELGWTSKLFRFGPLASSSASRSDASLCTSLCAAAPLR